MRSDENKGTTSVEELLSCDDEAEPEPAGRRDGWRVIGAHVSEPEAGEVSSQLK